MPDFSDDEFRIVNLADQTKQLVYDASGITTLTVRTRKFSDFNGSEVPSVGAITQTGISADQFDDLISGATACLIFAYVQVTTAGTSGTVSCRINWTDTVGATSATIVNALPLNPVGRATGSVFVFSAGGGGISADTFFTAKIGSPLVALAIRVLPLG